MTILGIFPREVKNIIFTWTPSTWDEIEPKWGVIETNIKMNIPGGGTPISAGGGGADAGRGPDWW